MIGYVMIGANDLGRAKDFYDEVLKPLGGKALHEHASGGRIYGNGRPSLGVVGTFDGAPATAGNGTMVALAADTTEQVRQTYAKAMEMGAEDEGEPGWRGEPGGFYGAYFRDLDRNKICVFRIGPED